MSHSSTYCKDGTFDPTEPIRVVAMCVLHLNPYTRAAWRDPPSSLIYQLSELPSIIDSAMEQNDKGPSSGRNEWDGKTGVRIWGLWMEEVQVQD
jgi:hypothetical protein